MISKSNVKVTDSEVRMASRFASSTQQQIEKLLEDKDSVIISFFLFLSLTQCIIKQLLDSVFVIFGIIKVEVSVISRIRLRLITLTSTLIIPDYTKSSSNNCL